MTAIEVDPTKVLLLEPEPLLTKEGPAWVALLQHTDIVADYEADPTDVKRLAMLESARVMLSFWPAKE